MTHPNQAPSPSDIRQEDVRELLPCPFCGQKPFERWEDNINGPKYPGHHFVWCENLDCPAPAEAMEETKYEAHRKWNTRAALSAQTGEPVAWREAIIEECAKVCDAHSEWAEGHIDEPPESARNQMFAQISNTADDCAAKIRDLASPPPQPDTAPSPLSTGEVREAAIHECIELAEKYDDCGVAFVIQKLRDLALYAPKDDRPIALSQPPATEQIRREVIETDMDGISPDVAKLAMDVHWRRASPRVGAPGSEEDIRFLALALAGEAGEAANVVKKAWRDGGPTNREKLAEEIAGTACYLIGIAHAIHLNLNDEMRRQMGSFEARYSPVSRALAATEQARS